MIRAMLATLRSTASHLRALGGDRKAVAAVEFALILPVLTLLYLGTVEVTNAITANRKVVATASTIGDLTAQSQDVTNEITNILDAASAVMQPFNISTLQMRITQVRIAANGQATVDWSNARGMTCLTKGAAFAGLPAGLNVPDTYVIFSEVSYGYRSPIGNFIAGTLQMTDNFWHRPRIGTSVANTRNC